MIRSITIVLICLLCGFLPAQQAYFSNSYEMLNGSNFTGAVRQTSDSGYICISSNYAAGNRGYSFIRLDKFGDTVFTKTYIYPGFTFQVGVMSNSILEEPNGDYLVCGYAVNANADYNGFLVRFNPWGDTLWTKFYGDTGSQYLTVIQHATPSTYWLCGSTTTQSSNGTSDFWIMRIDASCNSIWDTSYTTAQTDAIVCGSPTWDGGIVVSGSSGNDPYVIRTDSLGKAKWKRTYATYDGYGYVQVAPDSGYFVACSKIITAQNDDACLLKLDTAGIISWYKYLGEPTRRDGFTTQPIVTSNSVIVAGGSAVTPNYSYEGYIVKTDLDGNSIWQRTYTPNANPNQQRILYDIEPTFDNGFVAGGMCVATTQDAWVLKVDSFGCDSIGCDGVDVTTPIEPDFLSIYPNPASEKVCIDFAGDATQGTLVEILNTEGRIVVQVPLMNERTTLETGQYAEGIYFLRLISNGECLATEKLLIVR